MYIFMLRCGKNKVSLLRNLYFVTYIYVYNVKVIFMISIENSDFFREIKAIFLQDTPTHTL